MNQHDDLNPTPFLIKNHFAINCIIIIFSVFLSSSVGATCSKLVLIRGGVGNWEGKALEPLKKRLDNDSRYRHVDIGLYSNIKLRGIHEKDKCNIRAISRTIGFDRRPTVIVGHSFGGVLAYRLAQVTEVSLLVTLDAAAGGEECPIWDIRPARKPKPSGSKLWVNVYTDALMFPLICLNPTAWIRGIFDKDYNPLTHCFTQGDMWGKEDNADNYSIGVIHDMAPEMYARVEPQVLDALQGNGSSKR